MSLSLLDVRRFATEVALEEAPGLEVLAAMSAEGAAEYAEIMLTARERRSKTRRVVLGISRSGTAAHVREDFRGRLRAHLLARPRSRRSHRSTG